MISDDSDVKGIMEDLFRNVDVVAAWDAHTETATRITTPLEVFLHRAPSPDNWGVTALPNRIGFVEYLNRISVNPGDPVRTELIKKYFIFGSQQGDHNPGEPAPINDSAAVLDSCVRTWIDKSRAFPSAYRLYEGVPKREPRDIPRFGIVTGERGVGKTFLQNYILSEYAQQFDDEEVLWVRISLAREFDDECSVDYWIKAQIAKVLCRYYDPRSRATQRGGRKEAASFDFDAIFSRAGLLKGVYAQPVRSMLRILRSELPAVDRDISPGWMDLDVLNTVFNEAVDRGWGFIVILDGLDLLSNTDTLQRRFERRLASLAAYLRTDSPLWRYHLLFLREESMWSVQDILLTPLKASVEESRPIDRYNVAPVDLVDLYERRLTVLGDPEMAARLRYDLQEIGRFRQFVEGTKSGLTGADGSDVIYLRALQEVLGSNTRAAMQMLHAAAHEFAHEIGSPNYVLTDRMMRLGRALPPEAALYRLAGGGKYLERQYRNASYAMYDATFLPPILRFPYDTNASAMAELGKHATCNLLMGLRLLQIAACMLSYHHEGDQLTQDSLWSNVRDLFRYNAIKLRTMVEELIDEELLQVAPQPTSFTSLETGGRPLVVTPKGFSILNNYLFDPTYLNVSAFNLPIPSSLPAHRPAHPFFAVIPMSRGADVVDIVRGKVINAVALAKLVAHTNTIQENELRLRVNQLKPGTAALLAHAEARITERHGGLFSFSAILLQRVQTIGERILFGLEPSRLSRLVEDLIARHLVVRE